MSAAAAPVHAESAPSALGDAIAASGELVETVRVSLSNELVHLLSEQLYTSPLKALEELVANAYDADASECRIGLLLDQDEGAGATPPDGRPAGTGAGNDAPGADDEEDDTADESLVEDEDAAADATAPRGLIAIYDDGGGMNVAGLRDLWRVGASAKRQVAGQTTGRGRLIIGKFGIGKLATYAVANRITYLTATDGVVHQVLCDFAAFKSDPSGTSTPVPLEVRRVDDVAALLRRADFAAVLGRLGVTAETLEDTPHWTLCLLDGLKRKARALKKGRLGWVLRTAMPLRADFRVFLDGAEQVSSKASIPRPIAFKVQDLDEPRLKTFNAKYRVRFAKTPEGLVEPTLFPSGIRGEVFVAERTLVGKSDRLLGRSNGFFVRVRDRLVNTEDKLFYNTPLSFETFNRFRADLAIDDLHGDVRAPRESVEAGRRRTVAAAVARELFNQARDRFQVWLKEKHDPKRAPEHERSYVAPRLVERPVADALAMYGRGGAGVEADQGWFYMNPVAPGTLDRVVEQLYSNRTRYRFTYTGLGESERMTKFDPAQAAFTVNDDHELVRAFADEPRSRELLDVVATAEVMLEVYMKEAGIAGFVIAEVLERRDMLMRSLAQDRVYSLESIAAALRANADNDHELELALVAAARALGFNAKHISGSGTPDGIARYLDSAMQETTITLEAKSSQGTPALGHLDFAGLKRHRDAHAAAGCLVIAPAYPGQADPASAVSVSAAADRISCWTVDDLARVVEAAERRQVTARQIAGIVTTTFTPRDVRGAVDALLADQTDMAGLYRAVMRVLQQMFDRRTQPGDQRKVSQIAALLSFDAEFNGVTEPQVRRALVDLAHSSRGAMGVTDDVIIFYTDFQEVTRRVAALTGELGEPRSLGTFRQ